MVAETEPLGHEPLDNGLAVLTRELGELAPHLIRLEVLATLVLDGANTVGSNEEHVSRLERECACGITS